MADENDPKEERYGPTPACIITLNGSPINKDAIYILKSEIDINNESPYVTNILVNPEEKRRYDALIVNIEEHKKKLISSLQSKSKVKKLDVEKTILNDFRETDFLTCIKTINETSINDDLSPYTYNDFSSPDSHHSSMNSSNRSIFDYVDA